VGDSTIYIELIKQAPYIAALILLVGIFLWTEDRRETKRIANAKELEDRREAHDREINNMWANSIKMITEQQNRTSEALMTALKEHDRASQERYEKIGITNDLIQAVKERQRGSR
jgi:hypothetical protein